MRGLTQKRVHAEILGQSPCAYMVRNLQQPIANCKFEILLSGPGALHGRCYRLEITVHDVDNCLSHNSRCCFRMQTHRERESTEISEILQELDVFDEERRRFDDLALGAYQTSSRGVQENAALEESGTLGERLELVGMDVAAFDL